MEVKVEVNSLRSWKLKWTIVRSLGSMNIPVVLCEAHNSPFNSLLNFPFNFILPLVKVEIITD